MILHAQPFFRQLLFILYKQINSKCFYQCFLLDKYGYKMFLQQILLKELIPRIDQYIISMDITKPTILLLKILINRLSILIHRHRLPSKRISLLKIILAAQPIRSIQRHLYFLINQSNPTFNKSNFLL